MRALTALLAVIPLMAACESNSARLVPADAPPLTIQTATLPEAEVGQAVQFQLAWTGGVNPVRFGWGALYTPPAWLAMSETGELSGTPDAPGTHLLAITAWDSAGPARIAHAELELIVRPAALQVTTTALPAAVQYMAYEAQLAAAGGLAPYTWQVVDGAGANGALGLTQMSMDATGRISGHYRIAGAALMHRFTVEVTDAEQRTARRELELWVVPPPQITTLTLPRATHGAAWAATLETDAAWGARPLQWQSVQPLPAGVTMTEQGTLYGLPEAIGLHEVRLECRPFTVPPMVLTAVFDLVVYAAPGFVHGPDAYQGNTSIASAANLGALEMQQPIVQRLPLSVSSNAADPWHNPVDFFRFTTPHRGEIEVEVFFSAFAGNLKAALYRDRGGAHDRVAEGMPGPDGNDRLIRQPAAPGGEWFLAVEAVLKNHTWHANAYMFRVRFKDLTLGTELVECDRSLGVLAMPLEATLAGSPVAATYSVSGGELPQGLSLGADGVLRGSPLELGMFRIEVAVAAGGLTAHREIAVRALDSSVGNFWQRAGDHRYFDPARAGGDGAYHEHYCEASVVAPHPAYGAEGAIYVLGGRVEATVGNVYVLHTAHHPDTARHHRLEDIGRPLPEPRQYLGAAFLQHQFGGYIYVVGGELYSNTAPSSGAYTCRVDRMQVADAAGNPLASPGSWEAMADLPADTGGRRIEGWAEFALVAQDGPDDGQDRLYLIGGRMRVETAPGSGVITREFNTAVLMFDLQAWHRKTDALAGRRFPAVGMIDGQIVIAGGRGPTAALDTIEIYRPDPVADNPALARKPASALPRLAQAVWYAAGAVHCGKLYVLNGWDGAPSPNATARLQRFDPATGSLELLAPPDFAGGFNSAVFHDGRLWLATGRDPWVPTAKYSLSFVP